MARAVSSDVTKPAGGSSGRRSAREEILLDSLETIFLERGLRGVTVGELASALRCSRATLYGLARSKEDLFLLVVDRLFERIRRKGDDAAEQAGTLQEKIVASLRPAVEELRRASRLFSGDLMSFPPARRLLERHQARRRASVMQLIEQGMREGIFRQVDPYLTVDLFLAAIRYVMQGEFLATTHLTVSDAISQAEELLLNGLIEPQARDGGRRRRERKKTT